MVRKLPRSRVPGEPPPPEIQATDMVEYSRQLIEKTRQTLLSAGIAKQRVDEMLKEVEHMQELLAKKEGKADGSTPAT